MRILLVLLLLAAAASEAAPTSGSGGSKSASSEPGDYIVRLIDEPVSLFLGETQPRLRKFGALKATNPAARGERALDVASDDVTRYRSVLRELRADWLAEASSLLGRKLVPALEADLALNAIVLRLDVHEVMRLRSLPAVRSIERSVPVEALADASAEWVRAIPVWETPPPVGNRGEGIVIGIIDSGIRSTHPSFQAVAPGDGYVHRNPLGSGYLGLCVDKPSLCNDKLIGVYDFAVCAAGATGCVDPDGNEGQDSDNPHGSQVAGIAAGSPISGEISIAVWNSLTPRLLPVRVSGIAPRANIVSYRAKTSAHIVASIEAAISEGVDVLNLSRVTSGSSSDAWLEAVPQALLGARAAGISVAVSGGNNSSRPGLLAGNAPWTVSVASASHHRRIGMRVSDFRGGEGAPATSGWLSGVDCVRDSQSFACPSSSGGTGVAPLIRLNNEFACEPSNIVNASLVGMLVVCNAARSGNLSGSAELLRSSGAAGIVFLTSEGQTPASLTALRIAAVVLRPAESEALIRWLGTGAGHQARIEPVGFYLDPAKGDVLASYSSYGPSRSGPILKPEVTAPGDGIITSNASHSGLTPFGGTSASSPQVAGAMALVRAARPDWDVDAVESALLTTAAFSVKTRDGSGIANAFEQGSGRIDVERAIRAGLSFPQTISSFRESNPSTGGDPSTLNRPSLVSLDCVDGCSFQRRVRDLVGGGRWRVEVDAPPGFRLEATPSEFMLPAGGEQVIDIRAEPMSFASLGAWLEGGLRFVSMSPEVSAARIPVRVFHSPGALPDLLRIDLGKSRGFLDHSFEGLSRLQDLRVSLVEPAVPQRWTDRIAQHPAPSSPLPPAVVGSKLFWLEVEPAENGVKHEVNVRLQSQTAHDLDLYVGVDSTGIGQFAAGDPLCSSISAISIEQCRFEIAGSAQRQRIWIVVHSFAAGPGGEDAFELVASVLNLGALNKRALTATGPMRVEDGRATLRLAWDLPELITVPEMNSELQFSIGGRAPFARVPVVLARTESMQQTPRTIAPGGVARIGLSGGAQHPGLVVDVPPNASALTARLDGESMIEFKAVPAPATPGPGLPLIDIDAPDAVDSVAVEGGRRLHIEGAVLRPGRWYLLARNPGRAASTVRVSVEVESSVSAPSFESGAYYNPQRSGSGVYLYDAGDQRSLLWYAYLQDGTPTWYLGVAPKPAANVGTWRVPLLRFGWNGSAAVPTEVGEAVVTQMDGESVRFSWNLDGESGSETYRRIGAGACPNGGLDLNGTWYPPQRSGIGFSITAGAGIESQAVYLYDERGVARWLVGSTTPFGADRMPLLALFGSCPLCDYRAPQSTAVGELRRSYLANGLEGRIGLSVALPTAIAGSWELDLPVQKLTSPVGCAASR